ncbi:hypothetical protein ACUU08_27850, partial [Klebsiella pneumoniae]|uniref:hypothetical protein n=1 Tax=Klebsiella pneumoniae TaxID=573 RepID=UPI0040459AD5
PVWFGHDTYVVTLYRFSRSSHRGVLINGEQVNQEDDPHTVTQGSMWSISCSTPSSKHKSIFIA